MNEERKHTLHTMDDAYRDVFAAIRTVKRLLERTRASQQQANPREERKKEKMQLIINTIEHKTNTTMVMSLKRQRIKEKKNP